MNMIETVTAFKRDSLGIAYAELRHLPNQTALCLVKNFAKHFTDYTVEFSDNTVGVSFADKVMTIPHYAGEQNRLRKLLGTCLGTAYLSANHQATQGEAIEWARNTLDNLSIDQISHLIKS